MNAAFGDNSQTSGQGYDTPGQTPAKAQVGTPRWHTQRKENHREGMYHSSRIIMQPADNPNS